MIIIPGSESSCLVFQFMSVSVPEAAKITFWFVIVYIDAVNFAVVQLGSMFQVFLRTRLLTLYKLFHESLTDLVVSFSVFSMAVSLSSLKKFGKNKYVAMLVSKAAPSH